VIRRRRRSCQPLNPGEQFQCRIDYLYPEMMPTTRTLNVRVVSQESQAALAPRLVAAVTCAERRRSGAHRATEGGDQNRHAQVVIVAGSMARISTVWCGSARKHGRFPRFSRA